MENTPLPEKLRPHTLKGYVGQEHIAGKDGIIRQLLSTAQKTGFFPSLIFWGPPGSGKTTLARIISNELKIELTEFSAVNTSIKDIQEFIGKNNLSKGQLGIQEKKNTKITTPLIFIDEIHRFNKAQQDRLLPHVEKGEIILIGATTENPSFEVIGPLLSRSRVVTLNQLNEKDIEKIVNKGLVEISKSRHPETSPHHPKTSPRHPEVSPRHPELVSGSKKGKNKMPKLVRHDMTKEAKKFLVESANGDARVALNVIEIAAHLSKTDEITLEHIENALQRRQLSFDKYGEEYYNVISAFIKSMRASQPDAALYYLARMVEAGQDPLYIARRMVVFASEDIGMAAPTALVVANEVFRACETIGYPECAINLAHGVVYLATAKKDRRAYEGLRSAQADVQKYGNLPVPMKVRNAPTKLMRDLGYGKGYEAYTKESFLPDKLKKTNYFKKG